MKIRTKLLSGFLGVALLCAFVGILGVLQLAKLERSLEGMATSTIPKIINLKEIQFQFTNINAAIMSMANPLSSEDEGFYKRQVDAIAAAREKYGKALAAYEAMPMDKDEAALWKTFNELLPPAKAYNDSIVANVTKGRELNRDVVLRREGAEAERAAFFAAAYRLISGEERAAFDKVIAALDVSKQYAEKRYVAESTVAALSAARSALALMIGITVVIFALSTSIGLGLGNSIARSLKRSVAILGKVAEGDLSERMESSSKDEFGFLAESLARVSDTLRALIAAAAQLSEAIVAGRLLERADPGAFKGAYAELIGGLNSVVDGLVGFIDNVPTPALIIDKEYQILFMNKAGAALGGATSVEELARARRHCYEFFKSGDCRQERCACSQAMRIKGIASSETVARPLDTSYDISYTGVPVIDRSGAVVGAFEVIVDQTAVKSAERRAAKIADFQNSEILKLNKLLERMAAGDLSGSYEVAEADGDTLETRERLASLAAALNASLEAINEILAQVTMAVDQVSAGAQQVSTASQALSQGATEQASSLEEITSSITEVAGQTKQNTESAVQVNGLAKSARDSAEQGNAQMKELVAAMSDINRSAEEIGKIVKTIDDISFQINLLALNANVEAARAGKYGKGFAVVAEEVRNLAVRSANSVKDTTRMVEEAIGNIKRGNELVDVTAKQLSSIVGGAAQVAELAEQVSTASKEQSLGLEQVTTGLNQIDQVTQANTASAEESASAAEELSSQAQQLKSMLSRFKLRSAKNSTKIDNQEILQMLRAELARQTPGRTAIVPHPAPGAALGRGLRKAGSGVNPADVISLDDGDFGKF